MAVLETISVVEAAAQRLRERILDGEIASGASVTEGELASAFGVSRPTAKSAITAVVQSGLLRRDAHRSAYVPKLRSEDVIDVYRVRIPLELEVVRTLASSRTLTPRVVEAFERFERLPADAAASRFIATDLGAHQSLIDLYGSPRLSSVYESLLGEIHLCMTQSRRVLGHDRLVREHAAVLAHIRAGEPDAATQAMRAHLEGAYKALAKAITA